MNAAETLDPARDGEHSQQYLTFLLDGEEYGIDILRVQEIRGWARTRPLPNAPAWLKGIIDLRGSIVPIIDLRERFAIEALAYGPTTVVIVVRFDAGNSKQRDLGLVVDAVSEVHTLERASIKAAPEFTGRLDGELIYGIASVNDHLIMLLDMDRLRAGLFKVHDGGAERST